MIYNIKGTETGFLVSYIEDNGDIVTREIPYKNYFYVEDTEKAKNIIDKYKNLISKIEPYKSKFESGNYLKIYLNVQTFEANDFIYGLKNYGCKVYEHDITKEQQFIYDNGLEILKDGCGISEVPYVVFDIEVETKKGTFPNPERNFIFYIGAKGINNKKEKVEFYRSVANYESEPENFEKAEERLLNDFIEFLDKNKFVILSGYNIYNFDIYFIYERLKKYNKKFMFNDDEIEFIENPEDKNGYSRHPIGGSKNVIKYRKFVSKKGRIAIFDIYYYLYRMPSTMQEIRYRFGSLTLKNVSDYYGMIKKEEREMIEGSEIYEVFIKDPKRVSDYLIADVESTHMLYEKFAPNMIFLANIANMPLEKIFDASNTQILESALIKETKLNDLFVPPKTRDRISEETIKKYGGGHTEIHARGFFENVGKVDFSSLYPSIMLDWKIKPKNDYAGIFTKTLEKLYRKRIAYKKAYKELESDESKYADDPEKRKSLISFYKSGSDALKILINSAYGLLGFRRGDLPASRFTDLDAAAQVTAIGRNMITSVEDIYLKNGFVLIETDTDGIYLTKLNAPAEEVYKEIEEIVNKINAEFKNLGKQFVSIDFEDTFDIMVSVKKKNYFLVIKKGDKIVLKMHGSKFVNSSDAKIQKDLVSEIIKDITVNKLSMQELNKKYSYLFISSPLKPEEDFIAKFSKQPELFIKTLRVKGLEEYKEKIDIIAKRLLVLYFRKHGTYPLEGTDIQYYFTTFGGSAQRERIELAEDLDPRKIDYKKYLYEIKQKFIEIILDVYDTELTNTDKVKVKEGKVSVTRSINNPYYIALFRKDWMEIFFTNITEKRRQIILTTFKNHEIIGNNSRSIFGSNIVNLIFPEYAKDYITYLKEKISSLDDQSKRKLIEKYVRYRQAIQDKNSISYIQTINDLSEEEFIEFNLPEIKIEEILQLKQVN